MTDIGGASWRSIPAILLLLAGLVFSGPAAAQDKPRYGGELILAVPSEMPSYDGHREGTFGMVHPLAPHYNTLLKDRKSTRLNSSHQIISYAVFCLKKKKELAALGRREEGEVGERPIRRGERGGEDGAPF